ncbi:MAG: class I SAM-dependent rRNA methyltransferase [Saprospiraceae bacterium]|nr:class I SAM-dependent rRNA methyltransferase [Saprospiraceae bacterium]
MSFKGSIILKKGREQNMLRRHPWLFSGAIQEKTDGLEDGDLVELFDFKKNRLGFGHFHHGSIAVKILGFVSEVYDEHFWRNKLKSALDLRQKILLTAPGTDCFRWIHGEGDGLPGLVIDVYSNTVVIQCHSIGMHRQIRLISEACEFCFSWIELNIVDKSKESLPPNYGRTIENQLIKGEGQPLIAMENGLKFEMDPLHGQKTGFFLDQRDNRKLLGSYASGKSLLNAFCYTGGFSVYAASNGAFHVDSVDISQKAVEVCTRNMEHNFPEFKDHREICADVYDFLKQTPQDVYDLIVLDPPAFAKTIDKRHQAVQAYKRLNHLALKKIRNGSYLFTFSCSQVVDEALFYNTIVSAGIESGRNIRVLHKLTQAPDHPVNLFHPEGNYLKGLVLYIE